MALAIEPWQHVTHHEPAPRPVELRLIPGGRSLPPIRSTYRRRRLAVGLVAMAVLISGGLAVRATLGGLGGVPASVPAARPVVATPASGGAYVVQPGDTLWSIAQRFHGERDLSAFVDELVELNGGTGLQPGQQLGLPG
jgi:Tfp pilus assembly protein FimV